MKNIKSKIIVASLLLSQILFIQPLTAQTWLPLGPGISTTISNYGFGVYAMTGDSALFVAGEFNTAGDIPAYDIAVWNGSNWSSVGNGIGGGATDTFSYVTSLFIYNGNLYAAGYFSNAGTDDSAYNIAEWNSTGWSGLGTGIGLGFADYSSEIISMDTFNGNLYVGGYFDTAGSAPANKIAEWNGTKWSPLGSGIGTGYTDTTSYVYALAVYNGNLYAAGFFQTAGGNTAYNVAEWNGTSWSPLGSGIGSGAGDENSVVFSLAVYNGSLYAAGYFQVAGGNTAYNIAKWNGTMWSAVSSGIGSGADDTTSAVNSLFTYNGELYAGGYFSVAGGTSANNIAACYGTTWSALGTGIGAAPDAEVYPITGFNGNIYVGGTFNTAGGETAYNVAEYQEATGISEIPENNGTSIYPNPNNGILNLTVQNVVDRSQLQIYNLLGVKVYQAQITDNNTDINLNNEATGPYFYRVCTADGNVISTGKFIIQ